jgi:DNA modification methylase
MQDNKNTLYYGDNLFILREHIPNESVDLIYLDPPFNSNRSYNLLFKDEFGAESEAQYKAFEDSWHWGFEPEHTWLFRYVISVSIRVHFWLVPHESSSYSRP